MRTYEDAYILPQRPFNAGVISSDGNGVVGSNACERYRIGYEFEKTSVHSCDEEVIYMGYLKSIFGHCITDDLKRLWFLGTNEWKQFKERKIKSVYICPEDVKVSPVFIQILKWLGEDINNWIKITENTRFSKIYVPDNSLIYKDGERYWTKEFKDTIEGIKASALNEAKLTQFADKIYLSRTLIAEPSREMGEKSIEHAFSKWGGYLLVHPQLLSLADQITLMHNCNYIAATEGSVAHLAVFCKPGTLLAIIKKADYINTYQVAINEVADLNVAYIDAHHSHVADERWPWGGPFYLFKSPYLYAFFNKTQLVWPVFLRPTYWWYLLRQTKVMQRYISNRRFTKKIEMFLFS